MYFFLSSAEIILFFFLLQASVCQAGLQVVVEGADAM